MFATFDSGTSTDTFLSTDTEGFVVPPLPAKYFADAAMADAELPGDVTRPDPLVGELHDPLANDIWEGAAVHKNTPQLIHASMSWNTQGRGRRAGEEELCESFGHFCRADPPPHPQRSPAPRIVSPASLQPPAAFPRALPDPKHGGGHGRAAAMPLAGGEDPPA